MKKIAISLSVLVTLSLANVFTDKTTNLMWQDDQRVETTTKDWSGAINYCDNLSFAGYSDWRLPKIDELESIVDDTKYNPAIKTGFKNIASGGYWSSSPDVSVSSYAWSVDFSYGGDGWNRKSNSYLVRCVRDSKVPLTFDTFNQKVEELVKLELSHIPKPPQNLELIKGEFETTKEFETRVKDTKIAQSEAIKKYEIRVANSKAEASKIAIKKALMIVWGKPLLSNLKYDADNGYFVADLKFEAKDDFAQSVAIKVDRENAKSFKESFAHLKPEAVFDYDGGSVSLKDIRIPHNRTTYTAQFTNMKIDDTRVAVNLSNEYKTDLGGVSTNIKVGEATVSNFDASKLQDFNELDRLLDNAKAVKSDSKKWLFVVGIEKYAFTDNISYATRTAEMFTKVGMKKLGIPKENSFVLLNDGASQAKIKTNLQKMLNRVKDGDTIYFYYNGHGVPVANQNFEPFMLAQDTEPDYVADEQFFALNNIYGALSGSKAGKIVAFVDSCFSGVTDGKAILKGVAATRMKPKIVNFNKEKMVVISAGKGHQYSNGYDKKGYRMFSFFAMKNILASNNEEMSGLFKNIKKETYDASMSEYGDMRVQEPTIEGNEKLGL